MCLQIIGVTLTLSQVQLNLHPTESRIFLIIMKKLCHVVSKNYNFFVYRFSFIKIISKLFKILAKNDHIFKDFNINCTF